MSTVFIIHTKGYPTLVESLERKLTQFLADADTRGTARWYYDEFVEDGTEYGVRIDVQGLSVERMTQFTEDILRYCVSLYGDDIRVEKA